MPQKTYDEVLDGWITMLRQSIELLEAAKSTVRYDARAAGKLLGDALAHAHRVLEDSQSYTK